MSKAVFATRSSARPSRPSPARPEKARLHLDDGEAVDDPVGRAHALARRLRQDPLLGDREARLAGIRRRWFGWEELPTGRPE